MTDELVKHDESLWAAKIACDVLVVVACFYSMEMNSPGNLFQIDQIKLKIARACNQYIVRLTTIWMNKGKIYNSS